MGKNGSLRGNCEQWGESPPGPALGGGVGSGTCFVPAEPQPSPLGNGDNGTCLIRLWGNKPFKQLSMARGTRNAPRGPQWLVRGDWFGPGGVSASSLIPNQRLRGVTLDQALGRVQGQVVRKVWPH